MRTVRKTKTFVLLTTMIACVIGLGVHSVRAGTAIESFDYAAGTRIDGLSGGTGWSGAWIRVHDTKGTNAVVGAGSLSYPGITSSGQKMTKNGENIGTGDTRIRRFLETTYNSGTVYFSAIMQNLNGSLRYMGLSLYYDNAERTLVGKASNYSNWTQAHVIIDGVPGYLVSDVSSSQLSLLVLRVDFDEGDWSNGCERVTFWVNPDLSLPEDVTTAVGGQAYSTSKDFETVNGVRLGGAAQDDGKMKTDPLNPANYAPMLDIDEVRVSTISPFAAPALQIAVNGSDALLSWPTTGWTLQKTTALGTENLWINIAGTEVLTSTNVPVAATPEFFRLYQE